MIVKHTNVLLFVVCSVLLLNAAVNTLGQKGVQRTFSAKTNGKATMDVGFGINYAQDAGYVGIISTPTGDLGGSVAKQFTGTAHLCIGLTSFFDVATCLPIYYDKIDDVQGGGLQEAGLGDLGVSLKLLYPPPAKKRIFYQAYYIGGTFPTGFKDAGLLPRHTNYIYNSDMNKKNLGQFYSTGGFTFQPMMLWTFDVGNAKENFDFEINVNVGGIFSFNLEQDEDRNSQVLFNIALDYKPVEVIDIFVDFSTQSRWQNFTTKWYWGTDPLMLSPGIRINTPPGIYFQLAGDFALLTKNNKEYWDISPVAEWEYETYTAPRYGFQFAFGWNGHLMPNDADKDGLNDLEDRCPKDPEDFDHFMDEDGCPDPDNDNDNVPDEKDKCPNSAEDVDGFEDEDGCPDDDNDGDGILDKEDRCPNSAEDFDGIEDADGCPDYDNDKDGIPDSLDKCPNEPEDMDNFEDNDGCPDPDNDRDGILDLKDKCPNRPETMNSFEDEDGCPDEKKLTKATEVKQKTSNMPKHQVVEGINFASGSTSMTYSSYRYLDPIIREMTEFSSVQIEIRGHTDSVGKYDSNMRLSQKRAQSVRLYLMKKGVESQRIKAIGFGPSSPIADNRTAAGRSKNRRIEIIRIK